MTKDQLIKAAEKLKQPDPPAAIQYSEKKEILAARVIECLCQREDLVRLVGEGNEPMLKDNTANMSRFMESMFTQFDATVFVETILWVFRAYRSHGFQLAFWSAHLNIWIDTVRSELPEDFFNQIYPFYEWIQIHIPQFTALTESAVSEVNPEQA